MKRLATLSLCFTAWAAPQSDALHTLRGRLVDDLGGHGVPNARVAIASKKTSKWHIATTSADGSYVLAELPAGTYRWSVEKAGYFLPEAREYDVRDSKTVDAGTLTMIRKRWITGAVRWPDGEPAAGANLSALIFVGGKLAPKPDGYAGYGTDEHGRFRIGDLRPGRYFIAATYTSRRDMSVVPPRVGLPAIYPPPALGGGLDMRRSEGLPDVTLTLDERPGVRVEGELLPSIVAPAGAELSLALSIPNLPVPMIAYSRVRSGNAFRFDNVPEGSYLLQVMTPSLSRSFIPVAVGRTAIAGLKVQPPDPVEVQVKMELAGEAAPPSLAGVRVSASNDAYGMYGASDASSNAAGEAVFKTVASGEKYRLNFRRLPPDVYVRSVTQGTATQEFGPFEISAITEPVHVVLARDGATITGVLTHDGKVTEGFVVIAPARRNAIDAYRTVKAGADGLFTLKGIAPGDYGVFAFDRDEESSYLDAAYLDRYRGKATHVELAPNASHTVRPAFIVTMLF